LGRFLLGIPREKLEVVSEQLISVIGDGQAVLALAAAGKPAVVVDIGFVRLQLSRPGKVGNGQILFTLVIVDTPTVGEQLAKVRIQANGVTEVCKGALVVAHKAIDSGTT